MLGGFFLAKNMRFGYTTGTCATAAVKAAILAWHNKICEKVEVKLPQGDQLVIPLATVRKTAKGGYASVIKDAGDDPDITNGITVIAEVVVEDELGVRICGGKGIGTVTKPGLAIAVGEPAINPVPRQMIKSVAQMLLPPGRGCTITISIPGGELLAKKTLNPTLGIEGGISVIGTTGIVRPMSEEAFKHSLAPQISVAKAAGYSTLIFVPGKIGENAAVQCGLPRQAIVQTSNFIGYMLEQAADQKIAKVLLFGHLGKLVKVAAGIFHTHNRVADGRLETIAAYLAADGASAKVIQSILECTTTEAAMAIIAADCREKIYKKLAERATLRAERYIFSELTIGTVIVTLKGEILGFDENARGIGDELGWNIK